MIITKIPYDFIRQRVDLNWREVKFGLDHQLITPNAAIEKATERLAETGASSANEVELASLSQDASVADSVSRLASTERACVEEDIRAKWLYIVLAWLFENRKSVGDALGVVEEVYSDFGYPREIAAFVRYMPMVGADLGDKKQNEARLYTYWKAYLDQASKSFGRAKGSQL